MREIDAAQVLLLSVSWHKNREMERPTPTEHGIHEPLGKRWSPRAFSSRPVGDAELRSRLEAARWAPSCFNEQPWRFIVARREDELDFVGLFSSAAESRSSPQVETK